MRSIARDDQNTRHLWSDIITCVISQYVSVYEMMFAKYFDFNLGTMHQPNWKYDPPTTTTATATTTTTTTTATAGDSKTAVVTSSSSYGPYFHLRGKVANSWKQSIWTDQPVYDFSKHDELCIEMTIRMPANGEWIVAFSSDRSIANTFTVRLTDEKSDSAWGFGARTGTYERFLEHDNTMRVPTAQWIHLSLTVTHHSTTTDHDHDHDHVRLTCAESLQRINYSHDFPAGTIPSRGYIGLHVYTDQYPIYDLAQFDLRTHNSMIGHQ